MEVTPKNPGSDPPRGGLEVRACTASGVGVLDPWCVDVTGEVLIRAPPSFDPWCAPPCSNSTNSFAGGSYYPLLAGHHTSCPPLPNKRKKKEKKTAVATVKLRATVWSVLRNCDHRG